MKRIVPGVTSLIIPLLLINFIGYAQTISGDWYSLIPDEGLSVSFNLHLTEEDGTIKGTFDVPEQGAIGIPLSSASLKDLAFEFRFDPVGIKFSGITDESYNRILGYFDQGVFHSQLNFSREKPELPENSTERIQEIYSKQEVYIEMRDGTKLFTSIYTPKNPAGNSPILLFRTPYNAEPGGENAFNVFLSVYSRFIKEGYILAFQDVRGRYMSEGDFVNVRPFIPDKKRKQADEASDTYDTADWLVKNVKGNNGKIGVTGISYPGFYATMAILSGHPAIKAVSPQAPVANWFLGDDWHHNGAFFILDGLSFYSRFGDPHPGQSRQNHPLDFSWGVEDNYQYFMDLGPIRNTEKIFPDSVKYWHELFDHPDYDDWWKATVPLPHLDEVKCAVMMVGGWFDAEDLYGTLHTYKAIESQNDRTIPNYLVMGPWSHSQWAAGDARHLGDIYWGMSTTELFHGLEVDFFNRFLKEEGPNDFAEATIFMTGENQWREFPAWPPENTSEEILYFSSEGTLGSAPSPEAEDFSEYVSDPFKPVPYMEDVHLRRDPVYMLSDQRFASRRPDVVVYETDVLPEDFTLAGPVVADLFVSTTGTDADFVVKIIDVFPDGMEIPEDAEIDVPLEGYQMLVRGEVMRGKYRNSFEKPEPFVPGEITRVRFEIPDLAHTFKKGHRMMVQVQSSWFPLVDRNPQKFVNIYECGEEDFQKATIRIYSDSDHPSGLKVMVLE